MADSCLGVAFLLRSPKVPRPAAGTPNEVLERNQRGTPGYQLTVKDHEQRAEYFRTYKRGELGKFSKVPGWGLIAEGRSFVTTSLAQVACCRPL
jgi:hypothetical protein